MQIYLISHKKNQPNKQKTPKPNPPTPKKSGVEDLHCLVCHFYNHTGTDKKGHTL